MNYEKALAFVRHSEYAKWATHQDVNPINEHDCAMLICEYGEKLETELAEALAEIERLKHQLEDESMRADGMTTAHAEAGADSYRMRELIEQMREALNVLVASATPSGPLWHGSAEMQIARAALAAERGSDETNQRAEPRE